MNLLLDTHVLLWMASGTGLKSPDAEAMLTDLNNTLLFSVASMWEVAIKRSLDRPDFRTEAVTLRTGLLRHGFVELAIEGRHCLALASLPNLHGDPFDRLLLAQAKTEALQLVTADRKLGEYDGPITLI